MPPGPDFGRERFAQSLLSSSLIARPEPLPGPHPALSDAAPFPDARKPIIGPAGRRGGENKKQAGKKSPNGTMLFKSSSVKFSPAQ